MKFCILMIIVLSSTYTYCQTEGPGAMQIRNMIEGQIRSFKITPEAVFNVRNTSVWTGTDSIKIRIYYPSQSKNLPAIFNIHGGALVAGNLDSHDNISRQLCKATNSVVIALDYRKPPESPYPAGLNDTWFVIKWITEHAGNIGIDKNKIIVVSDSGGGLLAAALPIKIKMEKAKVNVQGFIFINPAIDLKYDTSSPPNPVYALVTQWYLGNHPAEDSLASPIRARDFSNFAPSLIIVCDKDELKPHGERLAQKLGEAGIERKLFNIPNEDHLGGFWAAAHPRAKPAIDETIRFIADLRR